MTTLTLIRHGETEWNRDGRWQGHADIQLSELGRAQARCLASYLARNGARFDQLYSSDLSRAAQTAEAIGTALGLPVQPLAALREIDLGRWSGLTSDEIAVTFADEWSRIHAGEDLPRGGAECFRDLQRRTSVALERLVERHAGEHLCIVTHGGTIRGFLLNILRQDWSQRSQVGKIDNTSLTLVHHRAEGWRVERVNDCAHLQDELAPVYVFGEGNV